VNVLDALASPQSNSGKSDNMLRTQWAVEVLAVRWRAGGLSGP